MLKEQDFIEVEYTGKVKENGFVFDTTDKATAEQHGIYNKQAAYGSIVVCLGQGQLLTGLDKALVGKDLGKFTIELSPENGFGKKNAALIELIATSKFKKENIVPYPGLQVNIDDAIGVIKTVTGGRTLVDFNHPLSGKDLVYDINVKREVTDTKEKVTALLTLALGAAIADVVVHDGKITVAFPFDLPQEAHEKISENIKKLVPEVTEIVYKKKEEEKKEEKPQEKKEQPVKKEAQNDK